MKSNQKVQIFEEGKIDIHDRKRNFEMTLHRVLSNEMINEDNRKLISQFIRDSTLGKTVIGRSKKRIATATCIKYLYIFQILCKGLPKSFNDITQDDLEKFVEKLENDELISKSGKPFSESTKTGIKKTIKKFWKWKDGNNRIYPALVEWIDTRDVILEIPALSREEIEKMVEHATGSRNKALFMVLFDSGARIEELLNVRMKPEHVRWDENLKCFMLRLEFSKTKPRTISLPLSSKHLAEWIEEHPARADHNAQLFPLNYGNLRMLVRRVGAKVIKKRVTPHILRHSSATYYANKLNHYQLCYRYGWTMSSNQVNRYIDRAGILEQETAGIVTKSEIEKANTASSRLIEQVIQLKEANELLSGGLNSLKKELQMLKEGKGLLKLILSLKEQEREMIISAHEHNRKPFDVVLRRPNSGTKEITKLGRFDNALSDE